MKKDISGTATDTNEEDDVITDQFAELFHSSY